MGEIEIDDRIDSYREGLRKTPSGEMEFTDIILSLRHAPSKLWIGLRKKKFYLTGHISEIAFSRHVPSIDQLYLIAHQIGITKDDIEVVGWSTTDDVFEPRSN